MFLIFKNFGTKDAGRGWGGFGGGGANKKEAKKTAKVFQRAFDRPYVDSVARRITLRLFEFFGFVNFYRSNVFHRDLIVHETTFIEAKYDNGSSIPLIY